MPLRLITSTHRRLIFPRPKKRGRIIRPPGKNEVND
ncbi:hypothetical protein SPAB_00297 [Salmonella enterica subsp. enterica serovar Paratyphi B str. SPB7]|uniref:Uncharacterized protein n=1 Tax=Salmonella paratyphi B (strain ATCC BAA-1250 / SPB7) TaxID=1016998 RepID=A0A6C6YX98_SALPB|nr:hypothetical protein SPAB_00297 [Salmonella enterica subsp. enterica serovar Paratyphi B str. SPB7]